MNFEVLEKFNIEIQPTVGNSFNKIRVESVNLCDLLNFLKNNAQFAFDRLNTIIAVDLGLEEKLFELIYDLHSIQTGQSARISVLVDKSSPHVPSVVEIFKSAYFDECEIFDMFGINFDNNPDLKRLYMPKGWVGNPLRKDYEQKDERLSWSKM